MVDTLCNNLEVVTFTNAPVPSNAFLIVCKDEKRCMVVDPGSKEQNNIRDYICDNGYGLDFILLSHEHFDHCWGVNSLVKAFDGVKVVCTRMCKEWVGTPMNYFNKLYFDSDEMYSIDKVDVLTEDIDWKMEWCGKKVRFIDAKGHTNRGMCIAIGNALFSGDTMIYMIKPFLKKKYGASVEDLRNTIGRIYAEYSADTIVYPGHGEKFKLGEMKEYYENYFAQR